MKYTVDVAGRTLVVDIHGAEVTLDGRAVVAWLDGVPGSPVQRIHHAGTSREVVVTPGAERGAWQVVTGGVRLEALVADERTRAIQAMVGKGGVVPLAGAVRAPMPGLVVRVLVEEGQAVPAGAGLVVVEAMKMENQLKAPAAGVVARVAVREGDRVEKGALLVELAPG